MITFGGKFKPVERQCRHPLSDGTVCLRKDRVKCPFHGIIIERDAQGNAVMHRDDGASDRSAMTSNTKRFEGKTRSDVQIVHLKIARYFANV